MPTIRPYAPDDLDALYAISLATGDAGGDAAHLYEDGRLIGHIYSAPYGMLAPQLVLVAADAGGVAGYVTGAIDTPAWEARLERDWWPRLRPQYADTAHGPPRTWTADQKRIALIHRPYSTPAEITDGFPGHIHMNLLPRFQGQGLGARLLAAWFGLATAQGLGAAHVGVNNANARGLRFWEGQGFNPLDLAIPTGRTVWMGRSAV